MSTEKATAIPTQVTIERMKFQPPEVSIHVGGTVIWTNRDEDTVHTATADDGSWDTGEIPFNESRSWTFRSAGVWPYHCEIHPSMTGKVTVK